MTAICAHSRFCTRETGRPSTRRMPLFHKAIDLDPEFASAHGMAAWCYFWRKVNGWMTDRSLEVAEGTDWRGAPSSWAGTMRSR